MLKSILMFFFLLAPSLAPLNAQEFIEDVHYVRLDKIHAVQTGEKIEVVELFWYHCPHCYRIEPYLNRWLKNPPEYVEYIRIPAVLTKSWELDARVFYVFEALGVLDELHGAYFDAIHKEQKPFVTEEEVATWVTNYGIDRQNFLDMYFNNFYVNTKMETARKLTREYRTDGVPTIVVDGKYRTKVSLAGGHDELIDLINHLAGIAKEERP